MKPWRVQRPQNSSCRIETGNRKCLSMSIQLNQIDVVLQTNQTHICVYLNSYPNASARIPIHPCHKQCCLTNINQHTKHKPEQIKKKQTKPINVDLADGISAQPATHIPPPYFVSKHCFKVLLIFFTEQPSYIAIYKSCSIHGYSEFVISKGLKKCDFFFHVNFLYPFKMLLLGSVSFPYLHNLCG